MKRVKKISLFSVTFFLIGYLLFLLFPQMLFQKKIVYKSFVVHSHLELDKNIFSILDSVESSINCSELHKTKAEKYNIYLCNDFFEYFFYAPAIAHSFACSNPLTNNIILSKSNVLHNIVERNSGENSFRTLSGTIVHEITHLFIKNHLGLIKYLNIDTWKNEGYSDFIAKEGSFDYIKGISFLCNHEKPNSSSFKYFKYRLYIEYLIKDKKLSYNEILRNDFDLPQLDKYVYEKYCR